MQSSKEIWILVEQQKDNCLVDACLPVLSEASKLAKRMRGELCAVLLGGASAAVLDRLSAYGVKKAYQVEGRGLETSMLDYHAQVIAQLLRREGPWGAPILSTTYNERVPDILLCPSTILMRDLAPRLSIKLGTGVVLDCVGFEVDSNGLLAQIKPVFAGKATGTFICPRAKPQIVTISSSIATEKPANEGGKVEVISYQPKQKPQASRIRKLRYVSADVRALGIEEADIIVSGGRGIVSADNFALLWRLAELLGGTVAGSRMALDAGWIPQDRLVGQTGKTISPRLYIACGISGASQHVIAIRESSFVVAINRDPDAPIFKLADVGIVGDALEVILALINELENR